MTMQQKIDFLKSLKEDALKHYREIENESDLDLAKEHILGYIEGIDWALFLLERMN